MELRRLGSTDIRISPVIMGTWQAGKAMWTGIEDADSVAAIRAAVDAGITTIDTAPAYGNGHSERMVARAVRGIRDRVVIATKVFADKLRYDLVKASCERSLADLDTDYVDLLQIHWPSGSFNSPVVPVAETMGALVDLKNEGKIRAIGVSNFSRAQLEEALAEGPVESLQPPYSLFWRQVEGDAMPVCVDRGLSILAYSPMAQGLLTGKFGPGHRFEKGDHRRANRLFQPPVLDRALSAIDRLRPVADRHGVTLGQLALAWVIHQPNACAIAGARNAAQAAENAAAAGIRLSEEDLALMGRIGTEVSDLMGDDPVLWKW